jgi:hypothetical protein
MPRFNENGRVTPQIGYSWFDQDRFIFQDCSTGVCRVALSDGTTIAQTGVVRLLGNGRQVWAYVEFTAGIDPTLAVYRDSFGRVRTNSYPQAIGPDGSICVKPHSNIGAIVIEANGREWELSGDDAQDVQLLGNGRAMWTVRGVPQANFVLIGNPGVPVWWARAASDGSLLYQSQQTAELVLAGHVVAPPSDKYFYPDVALINGVYHVCWSPSQADVDAHILTLTSAQLASLPFVGKGQPPVTPIPPPVTPSPQPPKPEPKPMNMSLPTNVKQIRDRFVAQFPVPHMGPDAIKSDDAFENVCRAWIRRLTEQVVYETRDAEWGVKNAGGGRPQSKDSLAWNVNGRLINYDLLSGVGTGHPTLVGNPEGEDITGQVFMPVEAHDYLGHGQPADPPPPVVVPPTPPSTDFAQCVIKLDLLLEDFAALGRAVDSLHANVDSLAAKVDAVAAKSSVVTFPNYKGRNRYLGEITLEPQK